MVTVVIVSYNTEDILRHCLQALFTHSAGIEMEVFVVDNNSADGSCGMVQKEFPAVRLISNSKNVGFAAANNQAFRLASGRYIILLNPVPSVQFVQISMDLRLCKSFLRKSRYFSFLQICSKGSTFMLPIL